MRAISSQFAISVGESDHLTHASRRLAKRIAEPLQSGWRSHSVERCVDVWSASASPPPIAQQRLIAGHHSHPPFSPPSSQHPFSNFPSPLHYTDKPPHPPTRPLTSSSHSPSSSSSSTPSVPHSSPFSHSVSSKLEIYRHAYTL